MIINTITYIIKKKYELINIDYYYHCCCFSVHEYKYFKKCGIVNKYTEIMVVNVNKEEKTDFCLLM